MSEKNRILIINSNCSWNKGSAAQVISTVQILRKMIPNTTFTLWSDYYPELDAQTCKPYDIRVIGGKKFKILQNHVLFSALSQRLSYALRSLLWSFFSKTGFGASRLLRNKVLKEFQECNLIIDLSGDSLSDNHNFSVLPFLNDCIALFLRKKIVAFSQSIGPFNPLMKPLALFYLNRANLLFIREKESLKLLQKISCQNPNIQLIPDVAFCLPSVSTARVQQILNAEDLTKTDATPLVGVGTSVVLYKLSKDKSYLEMMARLSDYIVEKLNAHVILVPHVINDDEINDIDIAIQVHRRAKNKNAITVLKGNYEPQEIKGIIGTCELFIGARMHSNIASTSLSVPTISIGWSLKYIGIMESLHLADYCCDINTVSFNELISKIDDAWVNKDRIRQRLLEEIPQMQNKVLEKSLLVKKLLE